MDSTCLTRPDRHRATITAPDPTSRSGDVGRSRPAAPRRAGGLHPTWSRAGLGRVTRRDIGPLTIGLLVVGYAALWLIGRPAGEPLGRHLGQLFGAESLLLLSIGLVLVSLLPWMESWFDGIDRALLWHHRAAATGTVLLVPHIALSSSPNPTPLGVVLAVAGLGGLSLLVVWAVLPRWRAITPRLMRRPVLATGRTAPARLVRRLSGGYDRWRALHRLTGLFVGAGFVHGALDATSFSGSPTLRWSYLLIGGAGLAAYGYRELVTPFLLARHHYTVEAIEHLSNDLTEVVLAPAGPPLAFTPGQFVMASLPSTVGRNSHPFTISSGVGEPRVRLTIAALGYHTTGLSHLLKPGMPAVISDPAGRSTDELRLVTRSGSPLARGSLPSSAGPDPSTTATPLTARRLRRPTTSTSSTPLQVPHRSVTNYAPSPIAIPS
jgi:predicted ferric reductase